MIINRENRWESHLKTKGRTMVWKPEVLLAEEQDWNSPENPTCPGWANSLMFWIHALGCVSIYCHCPIVWAGSPAPGISSHRWLTLQASPGFWLPDSHPKTEKALEGPSLYDIPTCRPGWGLGWSGGDSIYSSDLAWELGHPGRGKGDDICCCWVPSAFCLFLYDHKIY